MEVDTRYFCRTGKGKGIRIEVMADSMRVGKTTAVKVIGAGLKQKGFVVTENYEDWQNNPYLKASYTDPATSFLESQKWFARRKWEQITRIEESRIVIQDVTPEMDYNFALTNMKIGRMSRNNFREYEEFFSHLGWGGVPAPSLTIYLKVSDKKLIERAMNCKREFETVDQNYFLAMKKVNREWLSRSVNNIEVLIIDTDEINFAEHKKDRAKLVRMVVDKLKLATTK